jgi:hypothetical protein
MAATLYPAATYRPVVNFSTGLVTPTRGLIPHVQVGNNSLFTYFNTPANQVSSHLWLSKTGTFEQYVPFDRKAWAEVAGNAYWISCECEGFPTEDYTAIQVARLGEFYAWGMAQFGWKPTVTDSVNGYGIGTHSMGGAAWGGHDCPGTIRANRRGDILTAALTGNAPDQRNRFAAMPTLRPGDTGANVVTLQNSLNIIFGHEATSGDPDRLDPDGQYGARTQARVGSLQAYKSAWFGAITVDGICGPETWKKMGYILTGMNR